MTYEIKLTKEFEKDFNKVEVNLQKRIKKKMEEVAENPLRYKHLHYDLKDSCRIWIDKLRVVFSYNQSSNELYLEKIVFGHKY
ncbi:hypothetical protein COU57_01000 [Candidatus Pacearchaeota archaeon CG10_big_fil_rev_8_21_14_0_10_32_14]|nr:MAG: hypothetical protein COU57_01000 [Candidatus Pacearchaeota archaeon CG10_big_fil_rev_8_21_14_0_10_32_14]